MSIMIFVALMVLVYIKLPLAIHKTIINDEYKANPPGLFTKFYSFIEMLMVSYGGLLFITYFLNKENDEVGLFYYFLQFVIFFLLYFHRVRFYRHKYEYYSMEILLGSLLASFLQGFLEAFDLNILVYLSIYLFFIILKLSIYRNGKKNYFTTPFKNESKGSKGRSFIWAYIGFYMLLFCNGFFLNRSISAVLAVILTFAYFVYLNMINMEKEIRKECKYHDKTSAYKRTEYQKTSNYNRNDDTAEKNKNPQVTGFFDGCDTLEKLEITRKRLCKVYHPDADTGNDIIFKKIEEEYNLKKSQLS